MACPVRSLVPFLSMLALVSACGGSKHGAAVGDGGAQSSPCGECPATYACGTANGQAVCRAPSGVPLFTSVFVVVMENASLATLKASDNTPYLSGLEQAWASAADYHGVAHPSLPNYVAMTSGDTGGITCDCSPEGTACTAATCTILSGNCGCPQTGRSNLGDQIEAAHGNWRMYGEDMGTPCNRKASASYAPKHVPFVYYPAITDDTARCAEHVVDFSEFSNDLGKTPARKFSFISPNLVHDMHDPFPEGATNYAAGDQWLSSTVPPILDSDAFKKGGLLVIVWDEDDLSGVV
ncbi:MAG TPA: alkaline phosphatase family protein, partial [Polyangiaceae bacterium]